MCTPSRTNGEAVRSTWQQYNLSIAIGCTTNPNVDRKGDTNPYTSCNRNMFTHLTTDGVLAIRLPENEREIFMKKYKTKLQESYGVIRKEYIVVPNSLLKKTNELKVYFDISYAYAKTLKPQSTTKSKK
jgi:hypothetical protein